ncbi:MAG TPA: TAT-variant-translocated molybdopterin oxidoreductase, partial [Terriglobia bacterium]|nr:TAT-variant-translocated molybdopterin oxidoreductase [Terriglobia bacterium]
MSDSTKDTSALDLVQLAAKPEDVRNRFWRSLDELEETPAYVKGMKYEFPEGRVPKALTSGGGLTRRDILKLMGASAGLAGVTACTKLPPEKIVPYVHQPEEFVPGIPLFFATATGLGGVGRGVLVESHLGRPTKVEGNPGHPASLGAADVFGQASVLNLYDPDRSQVPIHLGRVGSWEAFVADLGNALVAERSTGGAGLRILTETITSPTLADQIKALLSQLPAARWHQYEPCSRDHVREGARLAFGQYVNTFYRVGQADVIVSLDGDFFSDEAGSLRYARDFAERRRMPDPSAATNRLYVAESTPTVTGSLADHRLPLRSSAIPALAAAVADGLGVHTNGASVPAGVPADWVPAVVRDLQAHRGRSLVVTGHQQPPGVHAMVHAINQALGNVGQTVVYTDPVEANPTDEMRSLRDLVADMDAGRVHTLVILGGNPVYNAPADVPLADALQKVNLRVHLGNYADETAVLCHWHIPSAHDLEAWSDIRGYDGTVSIIQPLIAPLYGGRSAHELVALLEGQSNIGSHELVKTYWQRQAAGGHLPAASTANFEDFWEASLNNGWVDGTALPPKQVALAPNAVSSAPAAPASAEGLEIVFRLDPSAWDGRYTNNAWLMELPRPFTKLCWDNALLIAPATASQLGLKREDVVKAQLDGREVEAPVFILPGQAAGSVTLHLGYGRTRAGSVGTGVGVNAYAIRSSDAPWIGTGVTLAKTGSQYHLVTTQNNHLIEQQGHTVEEESEQAFDRRVVRVATVEEFRKDPNFAMDSPEISTEAPSLYPKYDYSKGYQWGMSIDLNTCIGCNACVVACYAENNIAVVGKDEVDNGRDMQWIRVDTYFRGELDNPETFNEVVLCMHCENAPCEYVCPVGATMHNDEGLNLMVYNRCVGTRYCSNNCPYKVRRFNFKLYSDWTTPSLFPLRNPDVTVRS